MTDQINYTTINHEARKALGLSMNDYAVADLIHNLASNPQNSQRWCYASKDTLGEMLGLGRRSVFRSIERLIDAGLVEKHLETSHLRTTQLWFSSVMIKRQYQNGTDSATMALGSVKVALNKDIYKDNIINTPLPPTTPTSDTFQDLIAFWNTTYGTNYKPISSLQGNFNHWLQTYQLAEIKQAITNIRRDPFWRDKMTPTILFRQKNARGEPVNFIERLLAVKHEPESTLGLENEFVIYKKRKEDSASRQ